MVATYPLEEPMNILKRSITTFAAAASIALLVGTGPALASHGNDDGPGDNHGGNHGGNNHGGGDDDRVIRTGSCTGSADWKLKVKTDDGRLEVEGEVDSNQTGQRWAWTINHNGSTSARGTSRTTGRSGSFSVERKIVNLAGADRVIFRAVHAGQVCRGVINF
jgi:hypothetical protein